MPHLEGDSAHRPAIRKAPLPSEYMRQRRPDQFSDEVAHEAPPFDEDFFSYHLQTLTSRSDEKAFENFCRKLAQKEICPNLIPQTGPTGGGDSKVDTETYPVAEEITDRWYEGDPNAGSERWGFAISAKKDWKPKLISDVDKIIKTGRGYKLVFFISSQFIKDKDRASAEENLTSKHGTQIRILDRTWIIDKVFSNHHFSLASSALNIGTNSAKPQSKGNKSGNKKQIQLEEIERQIADTDKYIGLEYQLAEDCLEAAILSRELELNRIETDGRFDRAERIARKAKFPHQMMRIKYQRAWTACYWFDDFEALNEIYEDVEQEALLSADAIDLERLCNLLTSISSVVRAGHYREGNTRIIERTSVLRDRLLYVAGIKSRPNNALQARSLLVNLHLTSGRMDQSSLETAVRELGSILVEAENYGGYPFDQYFSMFEEIGKMLGESEAFDEEFEKLLPVIERRRTESTAGLALLKRGMQKASAGDYSGSLRLLGRAQQRLIKNEHNLDLILSLLGSAGCYENIGLPWAANLNNLAALSMAWSRFTSEGELHVFALRSVQRLIWIEIKLGRIAHALTYFEIQTMLAEHLQFTLEKEPQFFAQLESQDELFASLLLRCTASQLELLCGLPDSLEQLGLATSRITLLFMLGHHTLALESINVGGSSDPSKKVASYLSDLKEATREARLPDHPQIFGDKNFELHSSLLGCEWKVLVPGNELGLRIGEAFLGFFEALYATSLDSDSFPHRQKISIVISESDKLKAGQNFHYQMEVDGHLLFIEFSPSYDRTLEITSRELRVFLRECALASISKIVTATNVEAYLLRIAKTEEGFGRAANFADIFTSIDNIFGHGFSLGLEKWVSGRKHYPFDPARSFFAFADPAPAPSDNEILFGTGEAPEYLKSTSTLQHGQRRVLSVFNVDLWDQAKWRGILVGLQPNGPPVMGFIFENSEPAIKIFEDWRRLYGRKDLKDDVRVCIVRGVNRSKPASYTVIVSGNFEKELSQSAPLDQVLIVNRVIKMINPDPKNLSTFLAAYEQFGCYSLVPVIVKSPSEHPRVIQELMLLKRGIKIRDAWTLGEHEPDMMAISADDDPLIPEGMKDPPIISHIQRRRQSR